MLTVFRTEIKIGNQVTFAYSANEIDSNGNPINYLNNVQLAELIGLNKTTALQTRMSEGLKVMLGKDWTAVQGQYQMTSGGKTKVSLWTADDCIIYWTYHAEKGNKVAFKLICALAATSLDTIINDAFNRDYKKGQAESLTNARLLGKVKRRELTDAIKDYITRRNKSADYQKWIYLNITDAINLGIFNRRASQLKEDWDTKNPRDSMTEIELDYVKQVEDLASRLIDQDDIEPLKASIEALTRLIIPVCDR
jgi:hypothetical protein